MSTEPPPEHSPHAKREQSLETTHRCIRSDDGVTVWVPRDPPPVTPRVARALYEILKELTDEAYEKSKAKPPKAASPDAASGDVRAAPTEQD